MSIGLDLGSSGFRCLSRGASALRGRRAPACYVVLPEGQAEKLLLQRAFIPYSSCDGSYVVFGDNAVELSRALKLPLVPVFPDGQLPADDPLGRQIAATLIESVLPPKCEGELAAVVAPAANDSVTQFAQRVLRLKHVACLPVHAGTAAAVAELGDCRLTGLGLCVGSQFTSLAVVVNGQPRAELTVQRGCQEVDDVFAKSRGRYFFDAEGNRYLDARSVARWRETAGVDLASPSGDDQELLRSLVREWLLAAMTEFTERLESMREIRTIRGVNVLSVTGGPASMAGFDVLVADAVRRAQLPFNVAEVRTATANEYTIARGCLIAAEIERTALPRKSA
jgi:hypothetical protein